jgi:catecholate siderophore receptor
MAFGHDRFVCFDTVERNDRWQVAGGARWEYYDTSFQATDATGLTTTNLDASDSLVSGKAGLLFRVNANANVYVSFGSSVTPPGNANFALSAQPNNQNNPSVKPQESRNYEVGAKWDTARGRLSLTSAVFRTENKNVIFTVDAAAVPPLYNQDDGQIVNGVTVGAMGRITDSWDCSPTSVTRHRAADADRGQQRQSPDADATVFRQCLDDLPPPDRPDRRRRHSLHR